MRHLKKYSEGKSSEGQGGLTFWRWFLMKLAELLFPKFGMINERTLFPYWFGNRTFSLRLRSSCFRHGQLELIWVIYRETRSHYGIQPLCILCKNGLAPQGTISFLDPVFLLITLIAERCHNRLWACMRVSNFRKHFEGYCREYRMILDTKLECKSTFRAVIVLWRPRFKRKECKNGITLNLWSLQFMQELTETLETYIGNSDYKEYVHETLEITGHLLKKFSF